LPAQDIELMAQHHQLDILDLRGPAAPDQQLQHGYKDEVDEGEEHCAMLAEPAPGWRSGRTMVLAPFKLADHSRDLGFDLGLLRPLRLARWLIQSTRNVDRAPDRGVDRGR
jgi:hypothetical protein